jgi:hypothetical protein
MGTTRTGVGIEFTRLVTRRAAVFLLAPGRTAATAPTASANTIREHARAIMGLRSGSDTRAPEVPEVVSHGPNLCDPRTHRQLAQPA